MLDRMAAYPDRVPSLIEVPTNDVPRGPWSASSVESFTACPLKYWWQKVAKWETPSTMPLVVGRAVHGALENLLALPPAERTPEAGQPLLDAAVEGELAEVADTDFHVGIDPEAVREAAQRAFDAYFATETPADIDVVGLEREVTTEIRGLDFRGFIDRIALDDAGLKVTDYKTGAAKPQYWWGYWRQQLLYAEALGTGGEPIAQVELLFLNPARAVTRPVYAAAVTRAKDDLERAHEQRAQMGESARWEARTGPLCNYCDFRHACPARQRNAPKAGTPASDDVLIRSGLRQRTTP
jgi:putative RecB family exonuclease